MMISDGQFLANVIIRPDYIYELSEKQWDWFHTNNLFQF